MNYEDVSEWAIFFYDRPASPDEPNGALFDDDSELGDWVYDHKLKALSAWAEIHERYPEWAAIYNSTQLSQGLWAMFSHPYFWGELIRDRSLPIDPRARVVRSLALPYEVFVKDNTDKSLPHGWWMLWHMIRDPEERPLADVYLETLQRILAIDDERCQMAALHGLNHLDHPDRSKVVQTWLDEHADPSWDPTWVEQCRDGLAM